MMEATTVVRVAQTPRAQHSCLCRVWEHPYERGVWTRVRQRMGELWD